MTNVQALHPCALCGEPRRRGGLPMCDQCAASHAVVLRACSRCGKLCHPLDLVDGGTIGDDTRRLCVPCADWETTP